MNSTAPAGGVVCRRWFPLLGTLREGSNRTADLIAGVITAIVLVPQAVAFAALAGLPAQSGLVAAIVAPLVYAMLGTSRVLSVGPVSVAAIMVAATLALAPAGTDVVAHAGALAIMAGAFLLILATLRLGVLADALSHAALAGFTQAAAIAIIVSQLPALLGMAKLTPSLAAIDWPSAAIGMVAIGLLLGLPALIVRGAVRAGLARNTAEMIARTMPLIVLAVAVVMAIGLARQFDLTVALVGPVPAVLPSVHFSTLGALDFKSLVVPAAMIALISYVEGIAIARVFATRDHERLQPNRELVALGLANVASGLGGAMPVAGGFSRTVVNASAGARTQLASIVAAMLVALIVFTLSTWLALIPKTALAAIVMVAVARLISPAQWRVIWRENSGEVVVMVITFVTVLAFGFEWGLLAGAGSSLVNRVGRRYGMAARSS